jgi:hypothetical protein
MPEPRRNETLSGFTKRYMGSEEAKKSFPDVKQRYAVMRSEYRRKRKKA